MVLKNLWVIVLWMKIALALEGSNATYGLLLRRVEFFTSVHHKAVLVESKAPVARCNHPPPWRTLAWSTCNRRRHV